MVILGGEPWSSRFPTIRGHQVPPLGSRPGGDPLPFLICAQINLLSLGLSSPCLEVDLHNLSEHGPLVPGRCPGLTGLMDSEVPVGRACAARPEEESRKCSPGDSTRRGDASDSNLLGACRPWESIAEQTIQDQLVGSGKCN